MSDYLYDKSGEDPEVAALEELLGAYAHSAPLAEPPVRRRRWPVVAISLAAAAAVLLAFVLVRDPRPEVAAEQVTPEQVTPERVTPEPPEPAAAACTSRSGFAFQVAGGAARCGNKEMSAGMLSVGEWLETTAGATAEVRVADIGDVTVYGGSRLRLVDTSADQHRLELERGKLSARVVAPPRLFVIDTPGAAAVDLGCAYDSEVDAGRRTYLTVTSGAVSLEGSGREVTVRVGMTVSASPGRGPGLPVAVDTSAALRDAVARFDTGDSAAVSAIVAAAGAIDTLTLWHLVERTAGDDRRAVVHKLDQLAPRPKRVRKQDILAGRRDALEAWRDDIDGAWMLR